MLDSSGKGSNAVRTEKGNKMETEHEFTLVLDGVSDLTPAIADALFEAGCADATVSRQGGQILMDFGRSASSMREAIFSAIADIRKAGIGARVVHIDHASLNANNEESAVREVGAINSALKVSSAIEMDPTLRPFVIELLNHAR
jgi:hypothetical protein